MFIRAIENQLAILKKGEKWCEENNIAKTKMVDGKLAEDMKTLPFQVQTVSNTAKFVAVRVAGVENESWEDNETTLEQLYARLEKTLKFLKAVKPEPFVGKETAEVVLTAGGKDYKFTGLRYADSFCLAMSRSGVFSR